MSMMYYEYDGDDGMMMMVVVMMMVRKARSYIRNQGESI